MDPEDKIGKYFKQVRQRASRRKSLLNLLFLPIKWVLMLFIWFLQVKYFYILGTGNDCGGKILVCVPEGVAGIVFTLAPLMAAIGPSMLLTNALLWMIPPVRRVFDREAAPYPETSYKRSQKGLAKFSAIIILIAWPAMWIAMKSF